MAILTPPFRIGSVSSWYFQQKYIYNFNTTAGSPLYIHMKTSLIGATTYNMWMFEAVGYNYGVAAPIRCSWGFHISTAGMPYTNGFLYNIGLRNQYPGMSAHGVYIASDGYIVLRAYANGSNYYNGFTLNAYATRSDVTQSNVSIIAAVQTSDSGNYYGGPVQ
jgi:hypothetical protein